MGAAAAAPAAAYALGVGEVLLGMTALNFGGAIVALSYGAWLALAMMFACGAVAVLGGAVGLWVVYRGLDVPTPSIRAPWEDDV